MAIYYVDLSAAINGDGSSGSPFNSFASVNAGLWNTNEIRVKRGSERIINAGTRANIQAASGCLLTAYGDAAAPLPIISGGGVNFNPVWIQSGTGITVEKLHVRRAPASGIVCAPTTGNSLNNITLQDLLVTENTQINTFWGTDGLQIGGFSQVDPGTVTNVLAQRITARDNGGHGFKVRGNSNGVRVLNSTSLRSGLRTPSHGCGTAGHFIELNNTNSGARDIRTGWTNIAGNVWEHALAETGNVTSILSWFGAWISGAGPTYYKLPYSATPLTPGPGECGIGAANTIRINLNGVVAPTALTSLYGVYARAESVEFRNCIGAYTTDVNGLEGDGVYFDNGSYKCISYDCAGIQNQGNGGYLNDNTECAHLGLYAAYNSKGGIAITRGDGTRVRGAVIVCNSGTNGIRYSTGNQRAISEKNQIIGAATGIWTNDVSTNAVTENENIFVKCATRLQAVSSPGAASIDRLVTFIGRGNPVAHRAVLAIYAAERVN